MIHHLTLGTDNLEAGGAFYDAVLEPLGLIRTYRDDAQDGWLCWQAPDQQPLGGVDPGFWLCEPQDGGKASFANGGTIAFIAPTRAAVRDFHKVALANGGTCEGPPGLRPHYGENYYGTYVRDPVGNKIAAVCRLPDMWWQDLDVCVFGNGHETQSQLAWLVAIGKKRATAGAFTGTLESEPGRQWLVVDGRRQPVCVMETETVTVMPISEITEAFAAREGEGDGSLAYWLAVHERFFRETGDWAPDMLVEAEEFKLVEVINPWAVPDREVVLAAELASARAVLR